MLTGVCPCAGLRGVSRQRTEKPTGFLVVTPRACQRSAQCSRRILAFHAVSATPERPLRPARSSSAMSRSLTPASSASRRQAYAATHLLRLAKRPRERRHDLGRRAAEGQRAPQRADGLARRGRSAGAPRRGGGRDRPRPPPPARTGCRCGRPPRPARLSPRWTHALPSRPRPLAMSAAGVGREHLPLGRAQEDRERRRPAAEELHDLRPVLAGAAASASVTLERSMALRPPVATRSSSSRTSARMRKRKASRSWVSSTPSCSTTSCGPRSVVERSLRSE